MTTAYPNPQVRASAEAATARLEATIDALLGEAGLATREWLERLLGSQPARAFLARRAHPVVHMPVWAVESAGDSLDDEFLEELTYSSMCGYLFIRMLDDVMDGDSAAADISLLPVSAFFHTEFEGVYHREFEPEDPFWECFRSEWFRTCEAAALDARADSIDLGFFREVSGRKTRAMAIPMTAALYRIGRTDLQGVWESFVTSLGIWQQLYNDVFGWFKDYTHGNVTLVLSEAMRHAGDGSPEAWFVTKGLSWSADMLATLAVEVREDASRLGSAAAEEHIEWRFSEAQERIDRVEDLMGRVARDIGATITTGDGR